MASPSTNRLAQGGRRQNSGFGEDDFTFDKPAGAGGRRQAFGFREDGFTFDRPAGAGGRRQALGFGEDGFTFDRPAAQGEAAEFRIWGGWLHLRQNGWRRGEGGRL